MSGTQKPAPFSFVVAISQDDGSVLVHRGMITAS